jgi:hypothetical protein
MEQVQGSPLQQLLKEDGAITSQTDSDWISAEDVRHFCAGGGWHP